MFFFMALLVSSFLAGRLFSAIGKPFATTTWKSDLLVAFLQSILITLIVKTFLL
ncbi:MAG: hypothetical protein ACM32O_01255 [Clostridia bacterium]